MKNLKEYISEGIFDIDDNIDSIEESLLIGGQYHKEIY